MRAGSSLNRFAAAALLALLLALRCLAPAGFMPAFDHGAVMIVACPDAAPGAAMPMHRHGDHKPLHEHCPYASASAPGALGPGSFPLLAGLLFALVLPVGSALLPLEKRDRRRRPPSTGPPLSA